MPEHGLLEELLAGAQVDAAVFALRPDYRAMLLAVDGLVPHPSDPAGDALLQAAEAGLPRVNRLTDMYNAVSVLHQIPLGGEDLTRYTSAPRLLRATGEEPFDTAAGGIAVIEHPDPGEVVWCDDAGVTCRRWNWRQTRRTQLHADTTTALFILDALDPMTDQALHAAAEDLITHLGRLGPDMAVASRLIAADKTLDEGA
jgi:DNA/RNA-binding domain of Phe-tRNA-synthetase-like protein